MSTEPYVPTAGTVRVAYRNRRPGSAYFLGVTNQDPDAEFDRFIAKIQADALREAASQAVTQVENVESGETGDPGPYYHGARYGMRKTAQWLHRRADRIEEEA